MEATVGHLPKRAERNHMRARQRQAALNVQINALRGKAIRHSPNCSRHQPLGIVSVRPADTNACRNNLLINRFQYLCS